MPKFYIVVDPLGRIIARQTVPMRFADQGSVPRYPGNRVIQVTEAFYGEIMNVPQFWDMLDEADVPIPDRNPVGDLALDARRKHVRGVRRLGTEDS